MELSVGNICKSYRKNKVLRGITFTAAGGECVGVVGKNGCGKSTLLSILAGVQKRDAGEFALDGHDLFSSSEWLRRNVGYVPQGTPLIDELSARDNLLLWYSREQLKNELENGVLAALGVEGFMGVRVSEMSGGMKKRLSIGCAMFTHPPVLLLDEPCAALDLECKERIIEFLRDYKRRGGILVLASHDHTELELCDKWFVMREGVLHPYVYDGDIKKLVSSL